MDKEQNQTRGDTETKLEGTKRWREGWEMKNEMWTGPDIESGSEPPPPPNFWAVVSNKVPAGVSRVQTRSDKLSLSQQLPPPLYVFTLHHCLLWGSVTLHSGSLCVPLPFLRHPQGLSCRQVGNVNMSETLQSIWKECKAQDAVSTSCKTQNTTLLFGVSAVVWISTSDVASSAASSCCWQEAKRVGLGEREGEPERWAYTAADLF